MTGTHDMTADARSSREESIVLHFRKSRETLDAAIGDETMSKAMTDIADVMIKSLHAGNKVLVAGNGGSAADAQHIAGEFLSRLTFDRNPLPAIALTTDTSVLTAVGNDYGYEK